MAYLLPQFLRRVNSRERKKAKEAGGGQLIAFGKQVIEGVEAEGTRRTLTIPAGEIGNEAPIQVVTGQRYPAARTLIEAPAGPPRQMRRLRQ